MIDEKSENDGDLVTDEHQSPSSWSEQGPRSKALTLLLLVAIAVCITVTIYIINIGHSSEPFTEFYILGKNGKADNYPTMLKLNEKATVNIDIVSHEYSQTTYIVDISINGTSLQKIGPITLDIGQKWEDSTTFSIGTTGASQKVDLFLYKQTENVPYLKLKLLVDVN